MSGKNFLKETMSIMQRHNVTSESVVCVGSACGNYRITWDQFCRIADHEYDHSDSDQNTHIPEDLVVKGEHWMLRRKIHREERMAQEAEYWEYIDIPVFNPNAKPFKHVIGTKSSCERLKLDGVNKSLDVDVIGGKLVLEPLKTGGYRIQCHSIFETTGYAYALQIGNQRLAVDIKASSADINVLDEECVYAKKSGVSLCVRVGTITFDLLNNRITGQSQLTPQDLQQDCKKLKLVASPVFISLRVNNGVHELLLEKTGSVEYKIIEHDLMGENPSAKLLVIEQAIHKGQQATKNSQGECVGWSQNGFLNWPKISVNLELKTASIRANKVYEIDAPGLFVEAKKK